jgi:sugar phosphate isomerase/epimerase
MTQSPQLLLSGFSDEAADLKLIDQQFSVMAALGLKYFSLRFVDLGQGVVNVLGLSDPQIAQITRRMEDYGLQVSSVGSPIGKVKLRDIEDGTSTPYRPFREYLENEVPRICQIAQALGTRLIRGFSFYHPRHQPWEDYLSQATDQVGQIAEVCQKNGLVLGLEVEANLVGHSGWILAEMHRSIGNASLVLIFDGGNLVMQGYSTDQIFQQYTAMKPGMGWLHIKDFCLPANTASNRHQQSDQQKMRHVDEDSVRNFVTADQGESGHRKILEDLAIFLPELHQRMAAKGVPGVFADLEPHLKGGGQFGGYSGPDGFGVALRAFCRLCQQSGVPFHLTDFQDVRRQRGF